MKTISFTNRSKRWWSCRHFVAKKQCPTQWEEKIDREKITYTMLMKLLWVIVYEMNASLLRSTKKKQTQLNSTTTHSAKKPASSSNERSRRGKKIIVWHSCKQWKDTFNRFIAIGSNIKIYSFLLSLSTHVHSFHPRCCFPIESRFAQFESA